MKTLATSYFAAAGIFMFYLVWYRTHVPSQVPRVVALWKDSLSKISEKAAESLADPIQYENLFPDYVDTLKAEQYLIPERKRQDPATDYWTRAVTWHFIYLLIVWD